jgi:F-type H+-transporting ATPase subunit delta
VAEQASGVSGLAGRYATALFELARERDVLDATASDLASLKAMLDESEALRRLVLSPVVARDDQGKAMAALVERAGLGELTGNFVGLLASNRRLFALTDMIAAYETLLAAHRGEVTAEVISARPLSDAQAAAVAAALKGVVGSDVRLIASVDESLLGGLVVKLGSQMVDASLKAKLQSLELAMKGAA